MNLRKIEDRIILHLCAKEGSDTKPYKLAGYDVRIVGEKIGIENFKPPKNVYGIIANPPCTHFSIARANAKTPRDLKEGMRLVKECLRVIWECQHKTEWVGDWSMPLKFWALENPATGFLPWFLGKPVFQYSQAEYNGDYSKRTALWGHFNLPKRPILFNQLPPFTTIGQKNERGGRANQERSRCPIGFAESFFEANP